MGHHPSDDSEVQKMTEEGQASLARYHGGGGGDGGFFSGKRPVSEALITALLGAGRGMQAAEGAAGPWSAVIAGGAGGAETALALGQRRREEAMQRVAMTPLKVAHPELTRAMAESLGLPNVGNFTLSQVQELTPFFKLVIEAKKKETAAGAVPVDLASQLRGMAGVAETGQPISTSTAGTLAKVAQLRATQTRAEEFKQVASQVAQGMADAGTPLELVAGRGKDRELVAIEYNKLRKTNPRLLSIQDLSNSFRATQRRISTLNSQQTQNDLVAVRQFNDALDQVLAFSDKLPRGKFIPLNKLKFDYLTKVYAEGGMSADDAANAAAGLQAVVAEIAMQGSRVFSGSAPTDIRFRTDLERFNSAMTPAQLRTVATTLRQIANSRSEAILRMGALIPSAEGDGGQAAPPAPTVTFRARKR